VLILIEYRRALATGKLERNDLVLEFSGFAGQGRVDQCAGDAGTGFRPDRINYFVSRASRRWALKYAADKRLIEALESLQTVADPASRGVRPHGRHSTNHELG